MKISEHSKRRFYVNAKGWDVPEEFIGPVFNYFVYGLEPGSFYKSLLANDMFSAMNSCHPNNNVIGIKNLTGWLVNTGLRGTAFGNYGVVAEWLGKADSDRRKWLERVSLLYTEEEEVLKILREDPYDKPWHNYVG